MISAEDIDSLRVYSVYVAGEWHSSNGLTIPDTLVDLVEERIQDAGSRFLRGLEQIDRSSVFHQLARKVYTQGLAASSLPGLTRGTVGAAVIQIIGDYRADGKLLEAIYGQYEDLDELLKRPDEELLEDDDLALCASYVLEDNGQFYRAARMLEFDGEYQERVIACNILGDLWCKP